MSSEKQKHLNKQQQTVSDETSKVSSETALINDAEETLKYWTRDSSDSDIPSQRQVKSESNVQLQRNTILIVKNILIACEFILGILLLIPFVIDVASLINHDIVNYVTDDIRHYIAYTWFVVLIIFLVIAIVLIFLNEQLRKEKVNYPRLKSEAWFR